MNYLAHCIAIYQRDSVGLVVVSTREYGGNNLLWYLHCNAARPLLIALCVHCVCTLFPSSSSGSGLLYRLLCINLIKHNCGHVPCDNNVCKV